MAMEADFGIRLNKAHTGDYLGAKLVKSLKAYGIEKKVCI